MSVATPQVFRHRHESGWWEMVVRPPAPPLRGLVRGYTGYREDSAVPVRRREVPTGDVSLILSFGPRIGVVDSSAPDGVRPGLTSFVVPVDDSWALTEYVGRQVGMEITLTPLGASSLLVVPLHELRNQVVELHHVLGTEGPLLVERLAGAPNWTERFELVDRVLLALAAQHRAPSPAAAWAWRRLVDTAGALPIRELVAELGCSHRYLLTEFRRHVGAAPKTLARVLRCQRRSGCSTRAPSSPKWR